MARYRRSPGYCNYCQTRLWVSRRNHFFTKWHCERCGSLVNAVGQEAISYMESVKRQAAAEQAAQADPSAVVGGSPVRDVPWESPGDTVHTGLINRVFGWLV